MERILTEVMNSLSRSPDRRFVWAEMYVALPALYLPPPESGCRTCTLPRSALAPHELMVVPVCSSFFSRWFDTKSVTVKQQVKKFVENGQLEFVEGSPFYVHT